VTRQSFIWTIFFTTTVSTVFYSCTSQTATENNGEKIIVAATQTTAAFDYAYEKDGKIYAYNESSKTDTLIIDGMNPCISPSGQQIAFTESPNNNDRQISIIDLQTKKKKRLAVNNNNFYGAMWSPDGKYIAFNYYTHDSAIWQIGIIDSSNKNFKSLTNFSKWGSGAYSPTWTPDSKKIIAHDLTTIYIYGLDGKVIKTYSVDSIAKDHGISSNTRFFLTDNKFIFNGTSDDSTVVDTVGEGEAWVPDAIYAYNLQGKSVNRITPKGLDCSEFYLQGIDDILFTAYNAETRKRPIYKIKSDGQNLQLLFDNGGEISARQK
jgi:Tol biopolymer transport system component